MTYELIIFDERIWRKDAAKIPSAVLRSIVQKIRFLQQDPFPDGVHVKKLRHYDAADFRLRMGEYRVLFNRDDEEKVVYLLRILHRSKLY